MFRPRQGSGAAYDTELWSLNPGSRSERGTGEQVHCMFPSPVTPRDAPGDFQGRRHPSSPSEGSFPAPRRAGFVTCSEIISDLHRNRKDGTKSPLLSATSALHSYPSHTCSNASLLIPVYMLFSEGFGDTLQAWCPFTVKYFCVYFLRRRVFSSVTSA